MNLDQSPKSRSMRALNGTVNTEEEFNWAGGRRSARAYRHGCEPTPHGGLEGRGRGCRCEPECGTGTDGQIRQEYGGRRCIN